MASARFASPRRTSLRPGSSGRSNSWWAGGFRRSPSISRVLRQALPRVAARWLAESLHHAVHGVDPAHPVLQEGDAEEEKAERAQAGYPGKLDLAGHVQQPRRFGVLQLGDALAERPFHAEHGDLPANFIERPL